MATIKQIKDTNGITHDIIDTKCTSVDNHYIPTTDTKSQITATLSGDPGEYTLGSEYTVLTGITLERDAKGHVTNLTYSAQKVKDTNTNTDTKNTAGATNSDSKLFLVGATSQGTNPQTYSHDTAYVGTDGCLYSGGQKVAIMDGENNGDFVLTGAVKCGGLLVEGEDGYPIIIDNSGNIRADGDISANDVLGNVFNLKGIAFKGTDSDRILMRVGAGDDELTTTKNYGYTLKFLGSGTGVNNALALYADNQTADSQVLSTKWNNDGKMYSMDIIPHSTNTYNLGTSSVKWKNIYADGTITTTSTITATAFYESSDDRLKTFTEDYDINLDNLKNIKTGKFYWNADNTQEINGGVSAQTVEQYFPELVRENDEGFKTVNYDGLAVVAIAAIKKLTDRIEQLEEIVRNK